MNVKKQSAESKIKEIRRHTRKKYSSIEKFRKSSIDKLIDKVNRLEDSDILQMTQYHVKCHKRRNGKL